MKVYAIIFFALSTMESHAQASTEREIWLNDRRNFIAEAERELTDQSRDNLARIIRGIGPNFKHSSVEARSLYETARDLLLSKPGHAEYYEKRIRGMWDAYRSARKTDPSTADGTKFLNGTFYDFPVLRHLPSPETVRVLGDMVLEAEVFETENGVPNIHLAARALQELHHLPLASKPVQSEDVHTDEDLETYRLWYAQIKAGNRTFRFEGDPNEYTLAGPVRSSPDLAASPPKARDAIEAVSAGEAEFKLSTPWFGVMLGGVLVVGGLVYLVVSRGSRARPN
jgi:hypothetical protein